MQSNGDIKDEKIVIGQSAQDGVNMAVDAGAGITYGKYLQVKNISCLFTLYSIWQKISYNFFYSWTKS